MASHRFEAVLEPRGGGTIVEIPFDVRAAFGRARPPVRATVNGYTWRTTIAVYGGISLIVLRREVREAACVVAGEQIAVELELDSEPRVVEPPDDLRAALDAAPEARAAFDSLSYTHRKEYVRWIEEAKRAETRRRRVEKAVSMLEDRVPHP